MYGKIDNRLRLSVGVATHIQWAAMLLVPL